MMETEVLTRLFGKPVVVLVLDYDPAPAAAQAVLDDDPVQAVLDCDPAQAAAQGVLDYDPARAAAAVGRLVTEPPERFEVVAVCGRVAAVRIVPQAVRDPVVPLVLEDEALDNPALYWWAMAMFWKRLIGYIHGWPGAKRRAQHALRLVEGMIGGLMVQERAFVRAWLWGAFNGEAGDGRR